MPRGIRFSEYLSKDFLHSACIFYQQWVSFPEYPGALQEPSEHEGNSFMAVFSSSLTKRTLINSCLTLKCPPLVSLSVCHDVCVSCVCTGSCVHVQCVNHMYILCLLWIMFVYPVCIPCVYSVWISCVSGHSVSWWIGVWDFPVFNPAFSRGRQLVSFRFENRLHVPEHRNYLTTRIMCMCPACISCICILSKHPVYVCILCDYHVGILCVSCVYCVFLTY